MSRMKLTAPVILAAMLCAGSAESAGKFYATFSNGAAFFDDQEGDDSDPAFVVSEMNIDEGYTFGGAIGYKFNSKIRTEIELSYFTADTGSAITDTTIPPPNITLIESELEIWSGMFNGFYDIETGSSWVPSVGGGVGVANVKFKDIITGGFSCADLGISADECELELR